MVRRFALGTRAEPTPKLSSCESTGFGPVTVPVTAPVESMVQNVFCSASSACCFAEMVLSGGTGLTPWRKTGAVVLVGGFSALFGSWDFLKIALIAVVQSLVVA